MKLLITILTFMLLSFGVKAHSLNGVYECKTSSWSPFKTKVEIKDFKKTYTTSGELDYYNASLYIDDKKISKIGGHFYINKSKKESGRIVLRHNTIGKEYDFEGIKYIYQEKEFSEKTGSEWVIKRSVFCEEQ